MFRMNRIEFYITNVCNLNCNGCNRLNNYAFKGHQKWNDYKDLYVQWSKRVKFKEISILGGEPMLAPDFDQWLNGIADLWPDVENISIVTNGYFLNRWSQLLKTFTSYSGIPLTVEIVSHNFETVKQEMEKLENWLGSNFSKQLVYDNVYWNNRYKQSSSLDWPECNSVHDFWKLPQHIQEECEKIHIIHPYQLFRTEYQNQNNLKVIFDSAYYFYQPPLMKTADGWEWHDSDQEKAFSVCYFKTCPHLSKGKMYKCGPVTVIPDFIKQFDIPVPNRAKKIIDNYTPAEVHWDDNKLNDFILNIEDKHSIEHCKLCPSNLITGMPLRSTAKKVKL